MSTDGAERFPSEMSYGASKYPLESYARSAAAELGHLVVTVNTVSLGPVQTGWITPQLERARLPSIPFARIGMPDDIADVIVFVASFQARWITGQTIFVGDVRQIRNPRAWSGPEPVIHSAPRRADPPCGLFIIYSAGGVLSRRRRA